MDILDINDEWEKFCDGSYEDDILNSIDSQKLLDNKPNCSDIYISTKTKISYLNQAIDIQKLFWKVPIVPYYEKKEGIIKKEMKFNTFTKEELDDLLSNIQTEHYTNQHILTHIDNPTGRIKFKDVRKISIGLNKKDLLSYRSKKRSAFYNCFVVILRLLINDKYKEIHIKVFNTGKLEIPGIQTNEMLDNSINLLINILKPYITDIEKPLKYIKDSNETVLINSNFNCGYYINRDALYNKLKNKYNLKCAYDPCSYPGIQCEFYYDLTKTEENQNGTPITPINNCSDSMNKNIDFIQIHFMIFRTGSVLIVGKCNENVLYVIYNFLKNLLESEYIEIIDKTNITVNINTNNNETRKKGRRVRKKITISEKIKIIDDDL